MGIPAIGRGFLCALWTAMAVLVGQPVPAAQPDQPADVGVQGSGLRVQGPAKPAPSPQPPAPSPQPPAKQPVGQGPFRKFAPGVERTIAVDWDAEETVTVHDLVDLLGGVPKLEWNPNTLPKSETLFEMSKKVNFRRHTVWNLEMTFHPIGMIRVDIPQPDGKMKRQLIWYMVYHVKNKGSHLKPQKRPSGTYDVPTVDAVKLPFAKGEEQPQLWLFPTFVLECANPRLKTPKAYDDHLIPLAVADIQQREDPKRKLLSSVEMCQTPIPLSTDRVDKSVWGVAVWENVDPETDSFSIHVKGLTNAYKWVDPPEAVKPGAPPLAGRTYTQKTLKLNFWRPGDEYYQHEREIHRVRSSELDYEWVWR